MTHSQRRCLAAFAVMAVTSLFDPTASFAQQLRPDAQRGLTFVRTNCASCHAIGKVGLSPLKDAPPFRTLRQRYALEDLAEPLAEGIRTGHPAMPEWVLDPGQIDDLIAYLKTVQD